MSEPVTDPRGFTGWASCTPQPWVSAAAVPVFPVSSTLTAVQSDGWFCFLHGKIISYSQMLGFGGYPKRGIKSTFACVPVPVYFDGHVPVPKALEFICHGKESPMCWTDAVSLSLICRSLDILWTWEQSLAGSISEKLEMFLIQLFLLEHPPTHTIVLAVPCSS